MAVVEQQDAVSYDFLEICHDFTAAFGKVCDDQLVNKSVGNIFVCSLGTAALLWIKSLMHNLRTIPVVLSTYFILLFHLTACYVHLLRFISN